MGAANRVYEFAVGIEQSAQPDAGAPSATNDVVTLGFLSTLLKQILSTSRAAPVSVVAGTGILFAPVTGYGIHFSFIKGSGGAVTISANPQITSGTIVGQIYVLIGTDDVNMVTIADGTGLEMKNGSRRLKNGSILAMMWDGTNWCEMFWNNVGDLG